SPRPVAFAGRRANSLAPGTPPPRTYTLSLHDALPIFSNGTGRAIVETGGDTWYFLTSDYAFGHALERDTEAVVQSSGGKVLGKRSEEHTSELQSRENLVCRLLLEQKNDAT